VGPCLSRKAKVVPGVLSARRDRTGVQDGASEQFTECCYRIGMVISRKWALLTYSLVNRIVTCLPIICKLTIFGMGKCAEPSYLLCEPVIPATILRARKA